MGVQFTREFTILSCGPEDPSPALTACIERVKWTELKYYVGIMQRLYLKRGTGGARSLHAVPRLSIALQMLREMKCDFKGAHNLGDLYGMTFDLTIDPDVQIDGRVADPGNVKYLKACVNAAMGEEIQLGDINEYYDHHLQNMTLAAGLPVGELDPEMHEEYSVFEAIHKSGLLVQKGNVAMGSVQRQVARLCCFIHDRTEDKSPATEHFETIMADLSQSALNKHGQHIEYFKGLAFEKFEACSEALSKANWTESLPDCAEHSNVVAYYEDTKKESIVVQFRFMPC